MGGGRTGEKTRTQEGQKKMDIRIVLDLDSRVVGIHLDMGVKECHLVYRHLQVSLQRDTSMLSSLSR